MASGPQRAEAEEVLNLMHGGRVHDAEHLMEELLGAIYDGEEDAHQETDPHGMGGQ